MDGLDLVHINWTQADPEASLKMDVLHYGEVPFEGPLKGMQERYSSSAAGTDREQRLCCESSGITRPLLRRYRS
jgi:hypothetical protein